MPALSYRVLFLYSGVGRPLNRAETAAVVSSTLSARDCTLVELASSMPPNTVNVITADGRRNDVRRCIVGAISSLPSMAERQDSPALIALDSELYVQ